MAAVHPSAQDRAPAPGPIVVAGLRLHRRNVCVGFAERGASVWAIDRRSGCDWRIKDVPGIKRVTLESLLAH